MELMAIGKSDLPGFVDALAAEFELVAPVAKEFRYAFAKVDKFHDIAMGYDSTLLPPKKYLLPNNETLFTYRLDGGLTLSTDSTVTRRVIFGMHSCDINALHLLGDVMAEGIPDDGYLAKRATTFIAGMECTVPCSERSFCASMGTHRPHGGYDIYLTDLGELYAVQVGSQRAAKLMERGSFFPAGYSIKERYYGHVKESEARFSNRVGYDTELLPRLLGDAYDSLVWDALEERCFDCGACTVVCPTCYCFDVQDEPDLDLKGGRRYRRWDGCQMAAFAEVAGGGSFRGKRSDRIRHRILRKGKYIKERFGRFACVGCGRCGNACLAGIDILDIFRQLKA